MANDALKIREHLRRGDPQHPNILRPEPVVARGIAGRSIPETMSFAVNLDSQAVARAEEVQHIPARGMLVAETHSGGPFA